MNRLVAAVSAFCLFAGTSASATEIAHDGVACVIAGSFPRLEARLTPADSVGRARVVFRAEAGPHWYSVAMQPAGDGFAGVLPKPLGSLKRFVYYLEVTDRALETFRTAEYTPTVVAGLGACRDKTMAGALSSAAVALEAPVGAPLVPAGFASSGVVSVAGAPASAAGSGTAPAGGAGAAAGTAGATAAGMAAGVKAALIVGAGVAVAGGVAVAAAAGGGSDEGTNGGQDNPGSSPGPNPSPSPGAATPFYSITFSPFPPGLDVSACAGRSLNWVSQAVAPNTSGVFDQTWAPNEPNTLRVAGSVNETSFNATLTCISGPGSGTIQATGSGGSYQGTFSFGGRGGNVSITRQTT